jgi:hypothetical protein
MEEIKFELELQTPDSQSDILEFYDFLKGEVPGLQMQIKENPEAKKGAMSVELFPIIQMALSSTVASAGVTGIFSLVKDFFEFRRQKKGIHTNKATEGKDNKSKDDENKIVFRRKSKDGSEEFISITNFNDEDKKHLFELLTK